MKKSSKALKSQSISALICAPGPDFFFLRSGAGWQIKENQNRLAPGRLRPGKVYSLPKSDNGFCLIYYFCVGARSQMSPGAQRVSSRPWLAKREICQRTIFLGALCKIAIAANIYRFWAESVTLGSYLRDKDRLLSELNPVWVGINLNMDSYRKIYIVNLIFS